MIHVYMQIPFNISELAEVKYKAKLNRLPKQM